MTSSATSLFNIYKMKGERNAPFSLCKSVLIKTKLSFTKNLQNISQTFAFSLLQSDEKYGKIIPVERAESALTAEDMR